MRSRHVRIIGSPGTGKTTLMEAMILNDILQGAGIAMIDPYGNLVERILHHLAADDVGRTVYLRLGEPEWVTVWNPLRCGLNTSVGHVADALVDALKPRRRPWNDRTEHILRHALYAILHLPDGHLGDLADLLRRWSPESRRLRHRLRRVLDSGVASAFWQECFDQYRKAELQSALRTINRLLAGGTIGSMFSQPESSFSLHDVIDSGKILLLDLSYVSLQNRSILGRLFLRLLHLTACDQRGESEQSHRRFAIYVEEAGILPGGMEELIAEARRFNLSLAIAHQSTDHLDARQADALTAVSSTVVFRVPLQIAEYFQGTLQGKASVGDLVSLGVGQAFARIGGHVVRIQTHAPPIIPQHHHRDEIIARSRQLYCKPIQEVS